MLDNIIENLNKWDWRRQVIGEDKTQIASIIARIESGYYKTKEVNMDLSVIDLTADSFDCPNLFEFMTHYKLVEKANLKYPIIVNKEGQIIDGRHRLCKAILTGKKTIKVVKILDCTII